MSELTIIHLTRDQAWLAYRNRLVDLGLLPESLPEPLIVMEISVGDHLKVSRKLLQVWFWEGWRGLEQIPADCVVD
jgi:hypothetical protein